ncbi:MAG: collagen-like protein [Bacteroidota bacterium]
MKKIITSLIIATFLFACSGSTGPQGPPGPQGQAGVNILGEVFEVTVNFTPQNDYGALIEFPEYIEVFESDLVLIYLLEDSIPDSTGPIDVWTLLPKTYYLNEGILTYSYNNTFLDTEIFLDGTANPGSLPSLYTLDQVFRIAIVPADFAQDPNIDLGNYEQVVSKIEERNEDFKVKKLDSF